MVELCFGGFGEAGVDADAGVIDQKIKAILCENLFQHASHIADKITERGTLAHIQLQHRRAPAQLFDLRHQCLGFVGLAVVSADDVDALGGQVQCCVFTQTSAGAGDQCDFTGHGAVL